MRADRYLVAHGFFDTRARAQAAIKAGRVTANGAPVTKPSQTIPDGAAVDAAPAHPYVSRAALKLEAALDAFGVDPAGRTCLDIGASTGGFVEVLLERGAARVVAVDVGRDQLHASLRGDPRVVSLEQTDARELTADMIGEPPSLVTCDASFIALEKVLARPLSLAAPGAELVALFKPQFQVGRAHVGKGGIVSDPAAVEAAKAGLRDWLAAEGWTIEGWTESPIRGGDGNLEHLVLARRVEP
jgi:23S rRNA (cytidine1920-2'-O)/16S rRNA (cytidine1409-2'-O)-methyltransferase